MIVDIIYLIGIIFMLLTGINLIFSKNNSVNFHLRILATYFIIIALSNCLFFIIKYGIVYYIPHIYKTFVPFSFVVPVLGYFYIEKTLSEKTAWSTSNFFHFIPAIIIAINYLPFYLTGSEEKRQVIEAVLENMNNIVVIDYKGFLSELSILVLRIVQSWYYLVLSWLVFYKKRASYKSENSKKLKMYNWIKVFIRLKTSYYLLLPLTYFALYIINNSGMLNANFLGEIFTNAVFIITAIIFFALSSYLPLKPRLFVNILSYRIVRTKKQVVTIEIIKKFIITNELYKNAELNLKELSEELNVNYKEVTAVIQNSKYKNFRDFLKSIRLEEMIVNVTQEDFVKKSLFGLSEDYGFKSESTFYRAFKGYFNMTPQKYFSSKF